VAGGAATSAPASQGTVSGFDAVMKESGAQSYWIKRIVAFVIDAIIVYIVLGIIVTTVALPFLFLGGAYYYYTVFAGTFAVVGGLILVLYFTLAEVTIGGSLGKRFMGLKVVAASGRLPNFGEAFIRNISKIYWILLLLDVIVGLATAKDYTQKYTDRMVGTNVVAR
jgi:uncharacterized RDD family membrane protein YckC